MTAINSTQVQKQPMMNRQISYRGNFSKNEKADISKLLAGRNWTEFDFNADGKLDRNEVSTARMTVLSEQEEDTVDVDKW